MTKKEKPSELRPWMKYYPAALIENLAIPECSLLDYLKRNCPGEDITAIHYYGENISWKTLFQKVQATARALRMLNFKEGDQIPVFFKSVPEVIYLLLAAEMIGASILCRDNTLEENAKAVHDAEAKIIFAHDYLSQQEFNTFKKLASVELAVLLTPLKNTKRASVAGHINRYIAEQYPEHPVYGPQTLTWEQFLELGQNFTGKVAAVTNIHRPLLRAYTSGSTGPSKQVIHSANSIIGNIHQMNFYGSNDNFRPVWLVTNLPPSLIAVLVDIILLPLTSNKLLVLDPFCDPMDIDLEIMRYRPNCWPTIPMFIEILMRSNRVPRDHDLSHLLQSGAGCEFLNNKQLRRIKQFLKAHNCNIKFTTGYGSSEAGSNVTLPMTSHPIENGNIGIPMPLNIMGIFEPGTENEFDYNKYGEICVCGPSLMQSYGDSKTEGMKLKKHDDGYMWLHTGDMGYMNKDGVIYAINRGRTPYYGGKDLMLLPMENTVADLDIKGIKDEFFVFVPDKEHEGYFLPDLFLVLEEGYLLKDIERELREKLNGAIPIEKIFEIKKRPFFHYKTNRLLLTKMLNKGMEDFSKIF